LSGHVEEKEKRTCMRGMRGANQSFDRSASKKQKKICARGERGANWSFDQSAAKSKKEPV